MKQSLARGQRLHSVIKTGKAKLYFRFGNQVVKLPSNRTFGFFFTFVFALTAAYFLNSNDMIWSYAFAITSLVFLLVTLLRSSALLPLNKLWMTLGLMLGVIVNPIVLGIIFFGLFTPVAIFRRFNGKDELKLKASKSPSYWVSRNQAISSESFKRQF